LDGLEQQFRELPDVPDRIDVARRPYRPGAPVHLPRPDEGCTDTVPGVRWRWLAVGGLALVVGFALVLFRGRPTLASDQGVYLSVAARILDGDHLYSQTIENKDPLFFYSYAAALWIGGWRGPFLLDGVWFALAAVGFGLLLRELRLQGPAIVAGFFVYPLALSSGWYLAGESILGGLAIAPFAAWLWLRARFTASGVVLAVVMLLKLNLLAVGAAPIAAFLLLGAPEGRRFGQLLRSIGGLSGALAVAALVLAVRGELTQYLYVIQYNAWYSKALDRNDGFVGRAVQHLDVVVRYFRSSGRWQLPAAALILVLFAAAGLYLLRRDKAGERLLAVCTALTLVLTLASLALTAYWFHHLQVLAYPAALIAATLISAVGTSAGQRAGAIAAVACVAFALSSVLRSENPQQQLTTPWTARGGSASSEALEQARTRFYPLSTTVSYMVFGSNNENAHAVFISHRFDLVCRWFHLYPYSPDDQLDETTGCSRRERPMLILVTLGFWDSREGASWRQFVSNARHLLESRYKLVESVHPGFQVWKLRASPTASA
jgi:hypothetical protein